MWSSLMPFAGRLFVCGLSQVIPFPQGWNAFHPSFHSYNLQDKPPFSSLTNPHHSLSYFSATQAIPFPGVFWGVVKSNKIASLFFVWMRSDLLARLLLGLERDTDSPQHRSSSSSSSFFSCYLCHLPPRTLSKYIELLTSQKATVLVQFLVWDGICAV